MNNPNLKLTGVFVGALLLHSAAHGQILFSDDFQVNSSANWQIFGTNDFNAQFAFDYGTQGYRYNGVTNIVPSAPNAGGTTKGLKLTVNRNAGSPLIAAISLYPTGQNFTNNYSLKFDLWMDYSGDVPFGDGGSTEFTSMGINHTGSQLNWPDSTANGDGYWFSVSGEGGSGTDYRAFVGDSSPGPNTELTGSGGFLDRDGDGTPEQNNPDGSFSPFQLIFPAPPGQTAGAIGKQWTQVEVRQQNDVVSWLINGYLIAQHGNDLGAGKTFTSGNIMIGYQDPYFNELPDNPWESYALIDNLRVIDLGNSAPPPIVDITATDSDAAEPSNPGVFTISRSGATTGPLTVTLRISGTASNGIDYTTLPTSVTLLAGAAETNLTVSPINDPIGGEAVETIQVSLAGSPANYDIRSNYAIINLTDDDTGSLTASVTALRPTAYENLRVGKFLINLSNPNAGNTTVNFSLTGTATNGIAYTNIPTSVLIPAGETSATVYIHPINNSTRDPVRTNILTILAGSGYGIGVTNSAFERLLDDDVIQGGNLFADDFETNSAVLWRVNQTHSDGVAIFGYNYNNDGIPPAPRSAGTTLGLKLQANDSAAAAGGLSVSPLGQNFTGDFQLRFDMWINYNGPLFDGGSGSTEFFSAGIGTKGTTTNWSGGGATVDGVWFACDGDGGNGLDYRAWRTNFHLTAASFPSIYAAVAPIPQDVSNPYYASFGGDPAPDAQIAAYPGDQTGTSGVGNPGFAWHDVMITKQGNIVSWTMDGIRIVTLDVTGFTLSTNIFVGFYDPTAGSSPIPDLAFALVDNLRVVTLQRPNITRIEVVGTDVQIDFAAASADTIGSFVLQSASAVTDAFTDVSSTITSTGSGTFRATRLLSGSSQFYRIRR